MIKFTEDQLAVIEIIGYTPKLIKGKDGKSVLMLDYSTLTKEQKEKVANIFIKQELKETSNQLFMDLLTYGECIYKSSDKGVERIHPMSNEIFINFSKLN